MMSQATAAEARPLSVLMRVVLYGTAVLLVVSGGFGLYLMMHLLMLHPSDAAYVPGGQKEFIFRILWGIVAASFIATGLSLFIAALRHRRHNLIPGPTLYILGAALVIIAMILLSDGGILSGVIIGLAGFAMMWLEYRSANI